MAERWKCDVSAFDLEENVFYETTDTFFGIITFGSNAVIRADPSIVTWCRDTFFSTPAQFIMDGDHLFLLDGKLRSLGKKLAGEHNGYLHLFPERTVDKPSGFSYVWYQEDEIQALYRHTEFENALSFENRDRIAVVAYDGENLAAMAGCDDYLPDAWQIGIDTDKAYRHRGLGVYLVKELAKEIEKSGKLAYYNTWSPNIASTRLALSAGFYPVWMGYPSEDL